MTKFPRLPTMADVNARPHATPKHAMSPAVLTKETKRKTKLEREKAFRDGVWLRDEGRSRASKTPLARSGTDYHKVGEVHHVLPRSLSPELVYCVANGLLLSKFEHTLAETACPNDPAHRLLDIVGPADRSKPQTFIFRDKQGVELRRRTG